MLLSDGGINSLGFVCNPIPNLSAAASAYLAGLGAASEDLFFHALATLHSTAYREANIGALRQDWPRIPLPQSAEVLRASAALGREVAALLDTETSVPGVTTGTPRPELQAIAVIARGDGKPLTVADFALTAGWGHAGQCGVTMPGKGRVEERGAAAAEVAAGLAGVHGRTHDVYLNAEARWGHVPPNVWGYTLGGYQVLKKWLSYREHALLGRPMTLDEVKTFTAIARRIAALVNLEPALDASYARALLAVA